MLKTVHIKNLALIREAEIEFEPGLDILTGQTGAGKSIIISAVNLALGQKANRSMLRKDAEYGFVELLFTGVGKQVLAMLHFHDIETEDDSLIITRKITKDASISKINGQTVTLSVLKDITGLLADIHGQHDHQSLLDASKHMDIVDNFGGSKLLAIKEELKTEHAAYRKLRQQYRDYGKTREELAQEIELMQFELCQIDDAVLSEGEDTKLEEEFRVLSGAEQTAGLLQKLGTAFSGEENSVTDKVADAVRFVTEAYRLDSRLQGLFDSLMELESLCADISHQIGQACTACEFAPERFDFVSNRLDLINHLKAKYGNSIGQILAYRKQLADKAASMDSYFARKAELEKQIHDKGLLLNEISFRLSEKRKQVASELEPLVKKHLKDLNFLDCRFEVSLTKLDRITENGFDKIAFLISVNPGEPLKPLDAVASGGELSRIMLAVKSALAQKDEIATLIFDEIDTGISGKTAQMVAQKLFDLSKSHQVICISHLPQIAAMADSHYLIHKEVEDGSTISGIVKLTDDQMITEIAKLVGGVQITPAALANARDLKGNANFFKHKLT